MKYLKLFEDKSKFYTTITVGEYNDLHDEYNSHTFFTQKELSILMMQIKYSDRNVFHKYSVFLKYPEMNTQLSITKFPDEWFTCMFQILPNGEIYLGRYSITDFIYEYYKCDQIEGLMQLLKDKGVM